MAKDPENSKYQQYLARLQQLFQSRFSTAIIVATAVLTVAAIIVFAKALPRRSPSKRPDPGTRQSIARNDTQQGVQQSQAPSTAPAKEAKSDEETRAPQGSDSVRALATLQQEVDQIKQAQEQQIQTIASQLELITKHQEASLEAASKIAGQVLALSQNAAAISLQHQESVRAIAAIEAKIGTSQAREASSTPVPATSNNPATPATATSRLVDIHIPGVSATTVSNGLQLKFDTALFDRDDHLKLGAKARLREVAKGLAQSQEKVVVYVIGLAYPEPNTWPWLEPRPSSEVALLRACRVSTYLEGLGIFPPGAVLPRAGSEGDLPFAAGDINNRTVLLRIFPQPYARYAERRGR